jgi:hypothetical protein
MSVGSPAKDKTAANPTIKAIGNFIALIIKNFLFLHARHFGNGAPVGNENHGLGGIGLEKPPEKFPFRGFVQGGADFI